MRDKLASTDGFEFNDYEIIEIFHAILKRSPRGSSFFWRKKIKKALGFGHSHMLRDVQPRALLTR